MGPDGDLWHVVEARRDDGGATVFRIRELAPRPELTRIFVIEMPYPITELSHLPSALGYRKLAQFEEQWVLPACHALGWELVALKIEEGAFFLYLYGESDPEQLMMRLAPYDAALGFYDDRDPGWAEYGVLRELLDRAKALPAAGTAEPKPRPRKKARAKTVVRKAPRKTPRRR